MTFVIIAPGVRDPLPYPEIPAQRPLTETQPAARTQKIPGAKTTPPATRPPVQSRHHYPQDSNPPQERTPAWVAEQIMSSPVRTLGPEASTEEAQRLFQEYRFRHLPVVDSGRRLLGILSERDLLRNAAGATPHKQIRAIMVQRVLTATLDTPIHEIARVLFEQHIGALPIINDRRQPIGILSRSDILRALIKRAPLELWI